MADEVPLPELFSGTFDDTTLDAWVADLTALASIDQVLLKGSERAHSAPGASVAAAVACLRRGASRGVQVWYRLGEEAWCDTLVRMGDTTRIVRMRVAPELQ